MGIFDKLKRRMYQSRRLLQKASHRYVIFTHLWRRAIHVIICICG